MSVHRTLGVLCVMVCLGMACSEAPISSSKVSLVGEWSWVESCGGFAGDCRTPAKLGHSRSLVFMPGAVYVRYEDGQLKEKGSYKRTTSYDNILGKTMDAVELSGLPWPMLIGSLTNDSLVLIDDCIDCFSSRYARVSP